MIPFKNLEGWSRGRKTFHRRLFIGRLSNDTCLFLGVSKIGTVRAMASGGGNPHTQSPAG